MNNNVLVNHMNPAFQKYYYDRWFKSKPTELLAQLFLFTSIYNINYIYNIDVHCFHYFYSAGTKLKHVSFLFLKWISTKKWASIIKSDDRVFLFHCSSHICRIDNRQCSHFGCCVGISFLETDDKLPICNHILSMPNYNDNAELITF